MYKYVCLYIRICVYRLWFVFFSGTFILATETVIFNGLTGAKGLCLCDAFEIKDATAVIFYCSLNRDISLCALSQRVVFSAAGLMREAQSRWKVICSYRKSVRRYVAVWCFQNILCCRGNIRRVWKDVTIFWWWITFVLISDDVLQIYVLTQTFALLLNLFSTPDSSVGLRGCGDALAPIHPVTFTHPLLSKLDC